MRSRATKIKYWLIPMLIMVCICGCMSVGKTTARRNVVAGSMVFLQQQEISISSNLLMPQGQTILLDPMETTDKRSLDLETIITGGDGVAMLSFQYLNDEAITMNPIPAATFQLIDGTPHTFTFQLQPTVQYLEEDYAVSLEIKMDIYAGQNINGELLQSMSAVLHTTVKANPALIPDEPATEENESTEESESTEETESAEDTESTESTETDDDAEPAEIAPQAEAETVLSGLLTGMTEIVKDDLLGLCVTAPDGETDVHIAMFRDNQLTEFPAQIRYRMADSQSYTMLYDGGEITIPAGTDQSQLLVLDFSQLATPLMEKNFHLVAYTDTDYISNYLTVSAELQMPDVLSNEAPLAVNETVPLKVEIPAFWQGTNLVFEIQRLYDETEQMPIGTLVDGMLTIDSNKGTAAPGTYQLALRWYYGQDAQSEGVLIAEETAVFCVNYTAFVQPEREQIQFPTTEPTLAPGEEETQ